MEQDFLNGEIETGTTIVALKYKDGLVLAADGRTSTGSIVAFRAARKITQITERVFMCRSGSAADTQTISRYVRRIIKDHELETGEDTKVKSVASVARLISYQNKEHLLADMIIAGMDPNGDFKVFRIPLGGTLIEASYAISGSGSGYIYSMLDSRYHSEMELEECKSFARDLVSHAMFRDSSSGGIIRMLVINKNAVEEFVIPGEDVPNL
ncbi:putative signal peptide protein [Cryptosporidium canis]|uniref:Proteasome subunit beta n=1 Tax=Cryptosporidium canis TaxID=195482 RepID=A0ABQ8PBW5_9CRYT|nr:putative signal peptide protein [Cryptosporidium canis]